MQRGWRKPTLEATIPQILGGWWVVLLTVLEGWPGMQFLRISTGSDVILPKQELRTAIFYFTILAVQENLIHDWFLDCRTPDHKRDSLWLCVWNVVTVGNSKKFSFIFLEVVEGVCPKHV